MKLNLTKIRKYILDLLYPNRCPCCDSFIQWDELICPACLDALPRIQDISDYIKHKESKIPFPVYACFEYSGAATNGIISLKRGNNTNFAEFLALNLADIISPVSGSIDLVVPVPMASKNIRIRGYNQALLIASKISDILNIPLNNTALYKLYSDSHQHFLSAEERMLNVDTFRIHDNVNLSGKSILICDDVLTTGATAAKCAQLLISKGAENITIAAGTVSKLHEI